MMFSAHDLFLVAVQEILWKGFMVVGGIGFVFCLIVAAVGYWKSK